MNMKQWLVGVDEAGRGPLAGPVAVGLVVVPKDFDWKLIVGVGDSKQVTPKNRAAIFRRAEQLKKVCVLDFVVVMGSAKEIDKRGIAVVIRDCIKKGLKKLNVKPENSFVKLDGALRAPSEFPQETIIKGDNKELVIGLASICAKVTRDHYMARIAKKYPIYNFDVHKGYGTKEHRRLIAKYGISQEHRLTYCQNAHLWGKL
jgi:ribonuclease HII